MEPAFVNKEHTANSKEYIGRIFYYIDYEDYAVLKATYRTVKAVFKKHLACIFFSGVIVVCPNSVYFKDGLFT